MRRSLKNLKSLFKSDISDSDFILNIIFLDSKDSNMSEDDEYIYSDICDNLYKICKKQVDNNLKNKTYLPNRGETIGEFMHFLKYINY